MRIAYCVNAAQQPPQLLINKKRGSCACSTKASTLHSPRIHTNQHEEIIGEDLCNSWINPFYASRFTRTAEALTLELGMAIGWVCAAASRGATLRNLLDLFAQSFKIAAARGLCVSAKCR